MSTVKKFNSFKNLINEEFDELEVGDIKYWKETDEYVYRAILDNLREMGLDYDWWEDPYQEFEHEMKQKFGWDLVSDQIAFSVGGGQGDGASFEGSMDSSEVTHLLEKIYKKFPLLKGLQTGCILVEVSFDRHGRYSHERSVTTNVEMYCDDYEEIFNLYKKELQQGELKGVNEYNEDLNDAIEEFVFGYQTELEDTIDNWRIEACGRLYDLIQEYYDDLMADEYMEDMAIANGYEFDSEGNIQ